MKLVKRIFSICLVAAIGFGTPAMGLALGRLAIDELIKNDIIGW